MQNETIVALSWLATSASIVGAILNAKQKSSGFVCWIFANIAFIGIDIYYKVYAQAFLFVVYTIISSYGLYKWRKL